ncbi:MAG: fimbrial biogenesis outer membrane usher protein [Sphingomonadaceae bacterium]|nr:fimbrial biogenesis outer membrane usher protein [Sphingomonadaceae bacterium]
MIFVEVAINEAASAGEFMVARRGGGWLMRAEDLRALRIDIARAYRAEIEGESYVDLTRLEGVRVFFDEARQRLALTIDPERFEAMSLSAPATAARPTQGAFTAFVNYDVNLQYSERLAALGFIEMGASGGWGLLTSTATVQAGGGGSGVTRLDTTYIRDFPGGPTRLAVGDAVTDAPEWGRQVRFGGVRLGTEFSLQPGVITFPTPTFRGRATIPSQVELLVDNARRFQSEIDQGPFSIDEVPLVTGAGEVTLVVRDALGVEQRVTSSYYVSPRLLRRGLAAWSAEAGAERRDYGVRGFSYDNSFIAGTYRRGVTDWMTLESRAELSGDVRMAGGGANLVWAGIGEFSLAGAASQGKEGTGALWRVGFSRVTPRWSLSASYQRATRNFDQLGINGDSERIMRQIQLGGGLSLGRFGNLGVSYTDLAFATRSRTRVASLSYNVGLTERAYLGAFAIRSATRGQGSETTFGATLTYAFGPRSSGYAQADNNNRAAEYRHMPPTSRGFGYRLYANQGEQTRAQGELSWRAGFGEGAIEVAHASGETGARFQASGGLLWAGGRPHASRRVEGGLGLVEVPDQPNVRIYQDNRLVGRTDAKGRAVIPNLRPYEENRIALAPSDLPMEARMASDTLIVVPRYRGAALARFEVAAARPATLILHMTDGTAVRAGASARLGDGQSAFVGYDGELFLPNAARGMTIEVNTGEGVCRATLGALPDEPLPRIGPIPCVLGVSA